MSTQPHATKELKIGEFVIIGDHCYRVSFEPDPGWGTRAVIVREGDARDVDELRENFKEKDRILQRRMERDYPSRPSVTLDPRAGSFNFTCSMETDDCDE